MNTKYSRINKKFLQKNITSKIYHNNDIKILLFVLECFYKKLIKSINIKRYSVFYSTKDILLM